MRKTVIKVLGDQYTGKITETWREGKIELDGRLLDAGGRLVSPKHRYATAKFEAELPQKEAVVFAALRQLVPANLAGGAAVVGSLSSARYSRKTHRRIFPTYQRKQGRVSCKFNAPDRACRRGHCDSSRRRGHDRESARGRRCGQGTRTAPGRNAPTQATREKE